MEKRGTPFQNVYLNLTNIYEVCYSHNCQTVTMNIGKMLHYHFSIPVSIKHSIRPQRGFAFGHFRGARGGGKKEEII